MVAEYNYGKPVALIEYKEKRAAPPSLDHPTYRALIALADGYIHGPIPCVIVFYCSEKWWFKILPLNQAAKDWCGHIEGETITEKRFVTGLYKLRKKTLSDEDIKAIEKLNDNVT